MKKEITVLKLSVFVNIFERIQSNNHFCIWFLKAFELENDGLFLFIYFLQGFHNLYLVVFKHIFMRTVMYIIEDFYSDYQISFQIIVYKRS